MNNEIKEIKVIKSNHSYMIEYKNGGKFTQYGVEEDLLNYIINLQTIEQQYSAILSENAELENKITNLQEELKSANESITWWQNRFKAVERDKKDYKSRNEKAIEYIKENCIDDEFYINLTNKEKHIITVLNILEGEYKDE